jgi:transcriptional regulator with XRE-family HTH domain
MTDSWRQQFQLARRALRISVDDLARATGISASSIRAYESGRRNPPREQLRKLLDAARVSAGDANEIMADAGYAADDTLYPGEEDAYYYKAGPALDAAVELVPWPEFVTNDTSEVVAANAACEAIWGLDYKHERSWRTRAQMNLLSVASDHRFVERLTNWDEAIGFLAGIFKGRPRSPESLDDPSAHLSEVIAEFSKGNGQRMARLIDLFAAAPALPGRVRHGYRIVWRDDDFGEMRFYGLLNPCSEPDGLAFNDWIPIDAATWSVLEQVKARGQQTPDGRQ